MFGNLVKKLAKKPAPIVCRCRKARRHRDCTYCGTTALQQDSICGVCKEAGIDGKVIRGTGRIVCRNHKGE